MLLNHRYDIIRDLAEGSFGKTFLAEDTQMPTRQRCVIKQLKPVNDDRPGVVQLIQERFAREAAVLEAVGQGHSQIPRLLAYFHLGDETERQFYLVQEWVQGTPLSERVHTPWSEGKVYELLVSALGAIAHVHSQNIIHRDIKPDNIIIRESDNLPCLIDFGAVKELMNTVVSPAKSQASSVVIGTLGFMSPEQAVGRPVFSSDLYSLAMTAIYLLTARSPLEIPTDSRNGRLLWTPLAPAVSPRFAGILTRAIHPSAPTRFASASDMLAVLTEPQEQSQVQSVPVSASISPKDRPQHSPPSPSTKGAPAVVTTTENTTVTTPALSEPTIQSQSRPLKKEQLPKRRVAFSTLTSSLFSKQSPWLKVGGTTAGVLLLGLISIVGYRTLGSGPLFSKAELDTSSPGALSAGIASLEKKVEARPKNKTAQLQLIEGYIGSGGYETALAQIDDVVQIFSDDEVVQSQALYWKGVVEMYRGDYKEAANTITRVIEVDDTNVRAVNLLGRIYQETGQYDDALAQFQAATDLDSDFALAYLNQAAIDEIRGDAAGAEALLEKAHSMLDEGEEIGFYNYRANFYENV
ncbi:MAG: serine/threonine-protein kinase, partial [Cyanobacteria bacterium J06560_2]